LHDGLHPTRDCDLFCQVSQQVPEGKWTLIGKATVQGQYHHLHHLRNGNILGIRASHLSASRLSKRYGFLDPYDQDEYNSVVADYYWAISTEADFNDFHSTKQMISTAANHVGSYMALKRFNTACVDFVDDSGLLDNGVMAVGWGGQPFFWTNDSVLIISLRECSLENLAAGAFPYPTEVEDISK
jgi:hypothetical protein